MTTTTKVKMPRITLPMSFDKGAVKFVVRHYKDEHFDEIFKMFQNSLTDSTGMYTIICTTRKHSNRMRIAHLPTVSRCIPCPGGRGEG